MQSQHIPEENVQRIIKILNRQDIPIIAQFSIRVWLVTMDSIEIYNELCKVDYEYRPSIRQMIDYAPTWSYINVLCNTTNLVTEYAALIGYRCYNQGYVITHDYPMIFFTMLAKCIRSREFRPIDDYRKSPNLPNEYEKEILRLRYPSYGE